VSVIQTNFRKEFNKPIKSFVAGARLPQIQTNAGCVCGSRALAATAVLLWLGGFKFTELIANNLQQISEKLM